MRFFYNESTDAPYNLALEELIASRCEDEVIMLWRNRSAVIVGRNQNTAAEVDDDFVKANDIQVVRRMTGGGAVYHDPSPHSADTRYSFQPLQLFLNCKPDSGLSKYHSPYTRVS